MPGLRTTFLLVVMTASPLASAALGQAAAAPGSMRIDSVSHRLALDPNRMVHPTRLTYRTSIVKDSVITFAAELRVEIVEAQYVGAPAWLLAQSGRQGVSSATDTLIVARADLRPLHWTATQGAARLAVEFTVDSIFGAMSSPLGHRNIVLRNRPDLLVSATSLDAVLGALRLDGNWKDSAAVLLIDAGGAVTAPATLAVEGEERIAVGAGDFDCWVVSLETERGTARYWVSKDTPLVVRAEQRLPQLGDAVLARELAFVDVPSTIPPADRSR